MPKSVKKSFADSYRKMIRKGLGSWKVSQLEKRMLEKELLFPLRYGKIHGAGLEF